MAFLKGKEKPKAATEALGLVLFDTVQYAMRAERVLKNAEYRVRMVEPPPELRRGCDLAVEIELVEQIGVERLLKAEDVPYISVIPLTTGVTELVDTAEVTDFDRWVMVRVGNMKVAYEKATGIIVNVSGGGCPDIPYLHFELLDKVLTEAPRPRDIGFTLCALVLDRAFLEARDRFKGSLPDPPR